MKANSYQTLCQEYLMVAKQQQVQRFNLYRSGKVDCRCYQRSLIELACQMRHIDLLLTELE